MNREYDSLLQELGVNVSLHDKLVEWMEKAHTHSFLGQKQRPETMVYFDHAYHEMHFGRVKELYEFRKAGGKSIGTFCIYVPEEIALAADVEPFALCGGTPWSLSYADPLFPRDICPLIRSTFGMALSNTCPYKKLKDFAVGETTCDAKKKAWDLLGVKVMELPQRKGRMDRLLWIDEVRNFKAMMENLSGKPITSQKLSDAIRLMNRKRRLLQAINEFRKLPRPPISGLDALLVSQVALNHNIHRFIAGCESLLTDLEKRVAEGKSAYDHEGPRVMIAGTPSPLGYTKVHQVAESSGLRIVVDESCTGARYYRDLVDESNPSDIDGMLEAIADRYLTIDCSCFSPNKERVENVGTLIKDFGVEGVIQGILMYCHGYNVEAKVLENALEKLKIPSLKIVTDYSDEDREQLRVRIESFGEILSNT